LGFFFFPPSVVRIILKNNKNKKDAQETSSDNRFLEVKSCCSLRVRFGNLSESKELEVFSRNNFEEIDSTRKKERRQGAVILAMALIVCPSRRMGAMDSPVFANVVCKNATAPAGGISMKAVRLCNNGAAAGGVFVDNGVAAGVLRVTAVAAAASNENSWPASSSFLEKITGREAQPQWQTSGTVPKNQGASPAKLEKEKTAEHLQPLGGVEEEPPVVSTKELVSLQIPKPLSISDLALPPRHGSDLRVAYQVIAVFSS
jgi:hypothetical protein